MGIEDKEHDDERHRTSHPHVPSRRGLLLSLLRDEDRKRVGRIDGVTSVKVHFASARIEIDHDDTVSVDALIAAIAKAGYAAKPTDF